MSGIHDNKQHLTQMSDGQHNISQPHNVDAKKDTSLWQFNENFFFGLPFVLREFMFNLVAWLQIHWRSDTVGSVA